MSYVRLLWTFFRIGVLSELEYRANFFVQVFESLLSTGAALAGLQVVFTHTETLAGWHQAELVALLGVFFLVGGMIGMVIQPSMQRFMEDVRKGTLDFVLTKPEDAQFLVSVRQVEIWRLVDVALGLGLLVVATVQMGNAVGAAQALGFAVALLAGGAMVYSFWLILATFTFWFVRIENILVIFQSMYQAARWPISIYPPWLRITLTVLVPVAFAVTVPAQGLVGKLTGGTLLGAVALAAVMVAGSRLFWRVGIRHYSGASA